MCILEGNGAHTPETPDLLRAAVNLSTQLICKREAGRHLPYFIELDARQTKAAYCIMRFLSSAVVSPVCQLVFVSST